MLGEEKDENWIFLMYMLVRKTNIFSETDILRLISNDTEYIRDRWYGPRNTELKNDLSICCPWICSLLLKFRTRVILTPQFCMLSLSPFKCNPFHNPILNAIHRKEWWKVCFPGMQLYQNLSQMNLPWSV
jgi:hypothetical protein